MRLNDEEGNLAARVGRHGVLAHARRRHSAIARGQRRRGIPNRRHVGAVDDKRMVRLLRLTTARRLPTAVIVPVIVPVTTARRLLKRRLDVGARRVLQVVRVALELRREVLGDDGHVRRARGIDRERRVGGAQIEVQLVARVHRGRERLAHLDHGAIRREAVARLGLESVKRRLGGRTRGKNDHLCGGTQRPSKGP